jgi:hypothetical protein
MKVNHHEKQSAATTTLVGASVTGVEIHECLMCHCEFPKHLTLNEKREHIERHCQ